MKERALLVTVRFDSMAKNFSVSEEAAELEELCVSAGLSVLKSFVYRQKAPNAPLLIGRGKVDELKEAVKREKADVVVSGSELSSSQQRNLEEILGTKTIDRTQLILDIFAQRAKSTEGKLQVELAQLKYLLPRLSGKGIYLSRLGGGVGTRGPGEQKLEVDRRRIRERIACYSRELADLQRRRATGIQRKKEKEMPLIALAGYTNAGKSSLFNRLTRSDVIVKNQLFSTLDTTTRAMDLEGVGTTLLVDTVGFVRDLPHHLIESFKATLEEAVQADLLLHVIDASRPDIDFIRQAVSNVLLDLGIEERKAWLVFNKMDQLTPAQADALRRQYGKEAVYGSALSEEGVQALLQRLSCHFASGFVEKEIFIPKEQLGLAGFLYKEASVLSRRDHAGGATFKLRVAPLTAKKFLAKLKLALTDKEC